MAKFTGDSTKLRATLIINSGSHSEEVYVENIRILDHGGKQKKKYKFSFKHPNRKIINRVSKKDSGVIVLSHNGNNVISASVTCKQFKSTIRTKWLSGAYPKDNKIQDLLDNIS